MFLVKLLKIFYWSFKDKTGRFNYLNGILRLVPGELGMQLRKELLPKYFKSCGANILIHEDVRLMNIHKISIGDNVVLASGCFLQGAGEIIIGDNVLFGPDVKIWSANHVIEDTEKPILAQGWEYKKVIIEDGVWLAANVFILPGVTIPEGCVIGAGSVVNAKKYPPFSIISGNPARVIGNRKSLTPTKEE
jgi:acetyltransferase-like isoleucine patch superfamily enzyme